MKVHILTKYDSRFLGQRFEITGVTKVLYDRPHRLVITTGVIGTRSYSISDIEVIEITEEVTQ